MRALGLIVIGLMISSVANGEEHSLPSGAIVAFDLDECPSGWVDYNLADGRFLIGAGKVADEVEIVPGQKGGAAVHDHSGSTKSASGARRRVDNDPEDPFGSEPRHYHEFSTSSNPHLPPYVGVRFCKRR